MTSALQKYNSSIKRNKWAEMVRSCRESGMSVGRWCNANSIAVSTYYSRQRKASGLLNERTEPTDFYEIAADRSPNAPMATVHINGISADIYSTAREDTLTALIRVLRSC